jgi:hypothetical protein
MEGVIKIANVSANSSNENYKTSMIDSFFITYTNTKQCPGKITFSNEMRMHTWMYPKVSELASWSEHCKWYSSLPLSAVVSLFCESV